MIIRGNLRPSHLKEYEHYTMFELPDSISFPACFVHLCQLNSLVVYVANEKLFHFLSTLSLNVMLKDKKRMLNK